MLARERCQVERRQAQRPGAVNVTPETLRKLDSLAFDRLLGRGQFGDEQQRAEEDARVWVAITGYLFQRR